MLTVFVLKWVKSVIGWALYIFHLSDRTHINRCGASQPAKMSNLKLLLLFLCSMIGSADLRVLGPRGCKWQYYTAPTNVSYDARVVILAIF